MSHVEGNGPPPSGPRHRSPTMRSGRSLLFTCLLATCSASFAAARPSDRPCGRGNGHYYLIVDQTTSWQQARRLAESMMFMGVQGHLATITSEDENTFVTTQLGDTAGAWLGGEQLPGSSEPAGGWQWITGEPWVYTNWDEGEPNNTYFGGWGKDATGQSEERLQYHHNGTHWNDLPDDPEVVTPRFIVEWDVPTDVNDHVTFEPIESTFIFTPDATGCPAEFVGTFSFEARLTNISTSSLSNLVVEVTELTDGNLLQNADGDPGGVGAQLTVPQQDGFTDGFLSPDEFVDVLFIICLQEKQPFSLFVDVLGVSAPTCVQPPGASELVAG